MQLYLGEALNVTELFTPAGGVENLWDGEYNVSDIGWSLPMITAHPNVTVAEVSLHSHPRSRLAHQPCGIPS